MLDCQESAKSRSLEAETPQCQFFVVRKKRLCRMTVRPGRSYCGEHEPQPKLEGGQEDTRIPCPNDPKHTCYASKLQKHLSICNAREGERPAYIVPGVNAPAPAPAPRRALAQVPRHRLDRLIEKVNKLYEEHVKGSISEAEEGEIHAAVAEEYAREGRADSSRRHLRQASALLRLAEAEGLVRDHTCYVELGAGKGHLSYYAWRAWCARAAGSRVLLVDRASLRHKRDNKLRARAPAPAPAPEPALQEGAAGEESCTRLRADLAHLALARVPALRGCGVVGLAKHLCGVATDHALRCVTAAELRTRTRGLVLATCCHHRCEPRALFGREHLQELGIDEEDLEIMLGVVSWGTCGDGRSRQRRSDDAAAAQGTHAEAEEQQRQRRAAAGARAKALLDWARAARLRSLGLRARLVRFVAASASPENCAIVASAL